MGFGWFLGGSWMVFGWSWMFLGGLKRIKGCGEFFWWVDGEVVFVIA